MPQTSKDSLPFGDIWADHKGTDIDSTSPIDGMELMQVKGDTASSLDQKIEKATQAFKTWKDVPAPVRGELIRLFGNQLRKHKEDLGMLVTLEAGKILEEGKGEVQEMIDICDFAVGLSRQLYGLTIASERPNHVMHENWLPLGPIGVISAFNFPVAVWAWNTTLAIVCGDPVIWKPSEKTPLCALACQHLFQKAVQEFGDAPEGLSQILMADRTLGEKLVEDPRIALISATGSTRMGREVGPKVAARFGRSLLELGGNNAVIVAPSADLDVALPSLVFGAVGTCGQRCTSTRRIIVHSSIADELYERMASAYASLDGRIGDPRERETLIGPLIDKQAFQTMQETLEETKSVRQESTGGERGLNDQFPDAYYVRPALIRMPEQNETVKKETFAPIAYMMEYSDLEQALEMHNGVPQGLSGAIMTTDLREAEYFKRHADTGIANVNIGTSGAEIGGAFGGEKETGGGRESGSDSWKAYMRRQTTTTFYGTEKPALAQGISFD